MSCEASTVQTKPERVKARFEMLLMLFEQKFRSGLAEEYHNQIFINRELLHCAVKAYFDDIERYKAYAGSEYADRHKQAAYTMKWINRFRPIQLRENAKADSVLVTVNQRFAIYSGLVFLDPSVTAGMTKKFFQHLIYTLTYRHFTGKMLATLIYAIECAVKNGGKI